MTVGNMQRFLAELRATRDTVYLEGLAEGFDIALRSERNPRIAEDMQAARRAVEERLRELEQDLDRRDED